MIVSNLDDLFEIAQYRPDKMGRATVGLVDGNVLLRIPYRFRSVVEMESAEIMVDGEATAQQLTDLKTILGSILQATNNEIETQHGWTRYIEPLESPI